MAAPVVVRKSLEPWLYDSVTYYQHQIDGVRTLIEWPSFILADDMGLGKSLQALTLFAIDVKIGRAKSCIIFSPVTLKGNWADEIEKFTSFRYMLFGLEESKTKPGIYKSLGPKAREEQLKEFISWPAPKILICNYEQARAHVYALNAMAFDIGILDEAHYIKNPKSKRTKAIQEIYTKRSFMLTGTPLLNQVNELWPLLNRIDPDRFNSYYRFINRYCVFGGYKDKQIIATKNEAELRSHLHNVMLRRLKSEVLDLPDIQYIERRIDLLPEQRKLYDEVEKDLKLTIGDSTEPVDIQNSLTKFLRLKQICGTTLPFTGEDSSSKLDMLEEDAEQIVKEGYKIVIFTQFRDVLSCVKQRLQKRFAKEKLSVPLYELHGDVPNDQRQPIVKSWTGEPGPSIIICMIQVAGVGLNMTAARHILRVDKLFVPGLNKQGVDRCHRIGADITQPVQVIDYIARKSVEQRVEAILRAKERTHKDIIESGATDAFKKMLIEALLEEEGK